MKNVKRIIGFMLGTALLLTGCGGNKTVDNEQEALSAVLVDAQTVGRGDLVLSNQFVGTVSPEESVYIIPMAQGTVTETFFEVGDEVKAGDVLFKIDDSGARLQLEQARLSYTNAQQQADSALTTQQESTNLQLDSNLSSAQQAYETYQLQWVQAKDAKEKTENAVSKLSKEIKKLKDAGATEENSPELAEMNKQLETLKAARTQARDAYNSITVAYNAAHAGGNLRKETKGKKIQKERQPLSLILQLNKS